MQTISENPIIPPNAANYSLRINVENALGLARCDGENFRRHWHRCHGILNAPQPCDEVDVLLLMHYFLLGMPTAGSSTRELASTLGQGSTESPLFARIFSVPLPWSGADVVIDSLDDERHPTSVLRGLNRSGNLPGPYKTDIVVYDHPDRGTLKVTQWHADDPRGEIPHNHPWADKDGLSFISYIVRGGYTETITRSDGTTSTREYRAGDTNTAMYSSFHTVSDILPDTLTVLMCAPRAVVSEKGKEWGYLLFGDHGAERVGMNDPRVKDPTFLVRAAIQNASLRGVLK